MKRLRMISLLLCLVMLFSFASCSNERGTEESTTAAATEGADTDPVVEKEKNIYDLTSDYSFKNEEFNVSYIDYTAVTMTLQFDPESVTGDMVSDVLFRRNRKLEDFYKVRFVQSCYSYSQNYSQLEKMVTTDTDDFDLIMLINRDAHSAALKGYLLPTEDLTYVDLDKDYYYQDVNDQLSIFGKYFVFYGADALNVFEDTSCVLFNQRLARDVGIENLYAEVSSGDWTHERFRQLSAQAAKDLNGDGKWDNSDAYGCAAYPDVFYRSVWISAGEKLVLKDADDRPYFAAKGNERFINSYTEMLNFLLSDPSIKMANSSRTECTKMFASGSSLFVMPLVCQLGELMEMEDDFGLLPLPKYDKAQEKYHSFVADAWTYVVPSTNLNPVGTSILMEALAYETQESVIPTYYEQAMKYRKLRDNNSVSMLDLVRNTLTFDLGTVTFLSVSQVFSSSQVTQNPGSLTSTLTVNAKIMQRAIDDALAVYEGKDTAE